MNIRQAKEEIVRTVRAYLKKDETGEYEIPVERQRPLLLIGPPGIGKTAVMEQAAQECGINLVSYTVTHHTRQSMIGLPKIAVRDFGGREMSVTEYTMSEIVAAVYEQIEKSGVQEGILFLDEINCVSETLAPTMLQFLQYKTFGPHRIPDGFLIVTAGNPPQYNRSVRDFDLVTLDRVRRIDIEENFDAFKEYAYKSGVHGAVLSYLGIRTEHFYRIRQEVDGRRFVTARGWEDLSRILKVYEELELPVEKDLCVQYLQDEEIAQSFADYYALYRRYREIYRIPEILEGTLPGEETEAQLRHAPFDEKLSFLGLLIDALGKEFRAYAKELSEATCLFAMLKEVKRAVQGTGDFRNTDASSEGARDSENTGKLTDLVKNVIASHLEELNRRKEAKLVSREDEAAERGAILALERFLAGAPGLDQALDFADLKEWFAGRETLRKSHIEETGRHLTNTFRYLDRTFGEGQEMVLFLSELSAGYFSLKFVSECGNDAYYRYNRLLLLHDRAEELREELK